MSSEGILAYTGKYLCASPDWTFQVMGFRADRDHNTSTWHQSQGEQEENQKVHPGGGFRGSPAYVCLLFG